jgi:hypothetical protein
LIDILSVVKLSLAGCSPAEPASVSFDNVKVKNTEDHDEIAIKKQPTFCPLERIV